LLDGLPVSNFTYLAQQLKFSHSVSALPLPLLIIYWTPYLLCHVFILPLSPTTIGAEFHIVTIEAGQVQTNFRPKAPKGPGLRPVRHLSPADSAIADAFASTCFLNPTILTIAVFASRMLVIY
jgi:hypothetical protein